MHTLQQGVQGIPPMHHRYLQNCLAVRLMCHPLREPDGELLFEHCRHLVHDYLGRDELGLRFYDTLMKGW